MEKEIVAIKQQIKTLFENQKEQSGILKEIYNTNTNIEKMLVTIAHIQKSLDKTQADVVDLKSKPTRKWESVVAGCIGPIITGLIGYVLVQIGLR